MSKWAPRLARYAAVFFITLLLVPVSSVKAIDNSGLQLLETPFYDPNSADVCASGAAAGSISNRDYSGNFILGQDELKSEAANEPIYQQASSQVGVPWQIIAALHYREQGFGLSEPNSDGVYQITDPSAHTAGAYPAVGATLSQAQFLAQTLDAANFIKNKVSALATQTDAATIKNALYLYNGAGAPLYPTQATNLGFDPNTQAYEGSPYVMNFADARRDPNKAAPGTWQQYGTDSSNPNGGIGPANSQRGGFLVYVSLAGALTNGGCAPTTSCSSGDTNATLGLSPVRQTVVCLVNQELAKWQSGSLKPGSGYLAYSQNRHENWCADFASWIYNQAGDPLKPEPNWDVSLVHNVQAIGEADSQFHWHDVAGYTPRPGDIAVHGDTHVNIVTGVSGSTMTLVGGNQGGAATNPFAATTGYDTSKVTSYTAKNFSDAGDITGFVSPD